MSGGRWGAFRSVWLQIASILTTAILARLLSNEDFGIVAITVVVVAVFDLVTRVGIGQSLVRRSELTERDASTFFWASLFLGSLAGVLAVAVSTPAATLAGSADAAPLVAAAAVTLPLGLSANVPMAFLSRRLRFRAITLIHVAASLVYGISAISLAFMGFGAWAVVIGQVARSTTIMIGCFLIAGFRPRLMFDRRVIREELGFSAGILGGGLVSYANKNVDYWFVGNRLGTGSLGLYYVAYVIPNVIRRRVTAIGDQVLYPVVAKMQDDKSRIVAMYLRVVRLISFVAIPAMIGLAAVADLAVRITFGSEWIDAIAPLRVIAVAAAVTTTIVPARPIFPAMGRPSVLVFAGLASLLALGVGLAASTTQGTLVAVAFAVLVAAIVEVVVMQRKMKSELGVQYRDFLTAFGPFAISATLMAVVVWGFRSFLADGLTMPAEAAISIAIGAMTYLAFGRLSFSSTFREQLSATKQLLGAKSGT
jgi:PST family polysaccharide transporter